MKISQYEFSQLRAYVCEHCGIAVGDEKSYLLESRLTELVRDTGCRSFGEFYQQAKRDTSGGLRDRIVDAMTTNETLWFRDRAAWDVIKTVFLPVFIRQLQEGSRKDVRVWSAASSTGQEPYSLAMLVDDLLASTPDPKVLPSQFEILATDISASALFSAISGRYGKVAMSRGMSGRYAAKYFRQSDGVSVLDERLRERVTFKKFNLQDDFGHFGMFDLVLVRNVAIYFSDSLKRDLYDRVAQQLNPGGIVLLGAAEQLPPNCTELLVSQRHERVPYYRKRP